MYGPVPDDVPQIALLCTPVLWVLLMFVIFKSSWQEYFSLGTCFIPIFKNFTFLHNCCMALCQPLVLLNFLSCQDKKNFLR